jgi:hypothetical protein
MDDWELIEINNEKTLPLQYESSSTSDDEEVTNRIFEILEKEYKGLKANISLQEEQEPETHEETLKLPERNNKFEIREKVHESILLNILDLAKHLDWRLNVLHTSIYTISMIYKNRNTIIRLYKAYVIYNNIWKKHV